MMKNVVVLLAVRSFVHVAHANDKMPAPDFNASSPSMPSDPANPVLSPVKSVETAYALAVGATVIPTVVGLGLMQSRNGAVAVQGIASGTGGMYLSWGKRFRT